MSTVPLSPVGGSSTRLIILRGDSASGKTSTALALRPHLGGRVALLHQDHFRREVLHNTDRLERSRDAAELIVGAARQALDFGYDVILDGIFNLRDYSKPFEQLHQDHRGSTLIYQFDVGLDETIRRHSSRPLAAAFGEEKLREWYDGWQPLPWFDEVRIDQNMDQDAIVTRILHDMADAVPTTPGSSESAVKEDRAHEISALRRAEIAAAAALWDACGLTRPWNDPVQDAERALDGAASTILAVRSEADEVIATVMVGMDGHRGWVYYLAVSPDFRRQGWGRRLISAAEEWLRERGAPKMQLMVRSSNTSVAGFYAALGYSDQETVVLGKFLDPALEQMKQELARRS